MGRILPALPLYGNLDELLEESLVALDPLVASVGRHPLNQGPGRPELRLSWSMSSCSWDVRS